jgi:hypothetical protein
MQVIINEITSTVVIVSIKQLAVGIHAILQTKYFPGLSDPGKTFLRSLIEHQFSLLNIFPN